MALTCALVSRGRRGTWPHLPSFCVAGVALMALGSGGALGLELVAGDGAALYVAGMALGDMCLHFTWQAWHLTTSTFVLRGRRGTYGTVARLGWDLSPVTPRLFAWPVLHLATCAFVSRGRRGTWRHVPSFHVAGVALGDIYLSVLRGRRGTYGTWQAWHLATCSFVSRGSVALDDIHLRFAWQAWHL